MREVFILESDEGTYEKNIFKNNVVFKKVNCFFVKKKKVNCFINNLPRFFIGLNIFLVRTQLKAFKFSSYKKFIHF